MNFISNGSISNSLVDILSQENLGFVGTSQLTKAALCLRSNCSLRDSNTQWSGATRSPTSPDFGPDFVFGATRSHHSPDFASDFVSGATRSHNSPVGACGEYLQ